MRQRWARSLVDEYGYEAEDMAVEFSVKMGTKRKRADIVIFKPGGPRRQDTVTVIVEAKRENTSPKDKDEGVEQLRSYMSACSSCRFGVWVGSEKLAYEKSDEGEIDDTSDIPRCGDTIANPRRCHRTTRTRGRRTEAQESRTAAQDVPVLPLACGPARRPALSRTLPWTMLAQRKHSSYSGSGGGAVHHLSWSYVFPWCPTMFM